MNATKIEWAQNPDGTPGYTWNPLTGCTNHVNGMCKGGNFPCYAYRLANTRLKERYCVDINQIYFKLGDTTRESNGTIDLKAFAKASGDPFYPRLWPEKVTQPDGKRKPAGIFTCDMSDLFGDAIPFEWQNQIFTVIRRNPRHRFYLLTKQPQNLIKFSPFPSNAWVGVTATNHQPFSDAIKYLDGIEATVKYISFEPLKGHINLEADMGREKGELPINWVIIGAQTKPTVYPKIEWVQEIVEAADKAGAKVFLKDNLSCLIPVNSNLRYGPAGELRLRQEMPG